MYATAIAQTVYWLDANDTYQNASATVTSSSDVAQCQQADTVRVVPGGQLIAITMTGSVPRGSVFYLGEPVQFEFRSSTLIPGRIGLWRQNGLGTWDELLAPFDSSSGFQYFVGVSDTVATSPPGVLSTISGVELRLVGESEYNPEGGSEPEEFALETRITFLNR